MRQFVRLAALAMVAIGIMLGSSGARAETTIRFGLDWVPGSVHSPFFIALYKGYYKAEGLNVIISPGKGSVGLVQQMAAGVYDMGYPDFSVLTDFDSKNPGRAFPMLMPGYEQAPAGVIFLNSSGIKTPKQLEGKTLGAVAGDGGYKLFPTFAQHAGFDVSKVKIQYIEPKLRETLLAKHNVDAIIGQIFNTKLGLKADGVDPSLVGSFLYKDYGLDFYGNGIAANASFLKEHPDAVKAFIRASIKGFQDMAKDPEMAVQMTLKFQSLLNKDIELDRLELAMQCCMVTPNVKKDGFGVVDQSRLTRTVAILVKGFGLPTTPKDTALLDTSYLPPQQDRIVH
jgi:NitT/TauT family transport system substrate-binding protein